MTYRKNTRLGIETFVRLNRDGSMTSVVLDGRKRYYIGKNYVQKDWSIVYGAYSHINAREFNDAYNLVKENI